MKQKYLFLIAITGFLICLDQVTKMYIHTHFQLHESLEVIGGFFDITYVRNQGAAFGIFSTSHPTFREVLFLLTPPAALILILAILRGVDDKDRIQIVALSSIFGGAIGNYIDRLRFGWVIDFLDFYVQNYHWPAFNVADMAIVLGVSLLALLVLRQKEPVPQANAS